MGAHPIRKVLPVRVVQRNIKNKTEYLIKPTLELILFMYILSKIKGGIL